MHRRLLALIFAFLVPLQYSWAAVAAYCEHDRDEVATHVGHHVHEHKSDPAVAADSAGSPDSDCLTCQAGSIAVIPAGAASAIPPLSFVTHESALSISLLAPKDRPYRPKWSFSA